jgi:hypothetical protein
MNLADCELADVEVGGCYAPLAKLLLIPIHSIYSFCFRRIPPSLFSFLFLPLISIPTFLTLKILYLALLAFCTQLITPIPKLFPLFPFTFFLMGGWLLHDFHNEML